MTKNPRQSSYATLLSKVKERVSYLVRKYMLLQKALGEETPSTLADKGCIGIDHATKMSQTLIT